MSSRCTGRAFDRAAGRKWRAAAPSMPFYQQFQLIFAGLTSSGTAAARREAASASNSAAANVIFCGRCGQAQRIVCRCRCAVKHKA